MRTRLIMTVLWLFSSPAYSQPEPVLAFKGGFNAATLDEDNRENRYGFTGGLAGMLRWPLEGRFSLSGELDLLYTPRGADAVFGGMRLARSRQHYLDIMIAARPVVRLDRVSGYLLLGGGLSLLMSASKEELGVTVDITDDLRRVDVALLAGAGVAIHLPDRAPGSFRLGTVFLEARHDHGLIDSDAVNGGFKNRSSSLLLGLSLVLPHGDETGRQVPSSARRDPPTPASAAILIE